MNILIAEDDPVSRLVLERTLRVKGLSFTTVADGQQAWEAFQCHHFSVLLTDYDMPQMNGFELTRRVRAAGRDQYTYIIVITSASTETNYLAAIDAGVDDFVSKPIDANLLYARLRVAERIVGLRQHVKQLEGLLPICAGCKKIRDEQNHWNAIESYLTKRTEARFSHGYCPDCLRKLREEAGLPP